MSNDGPSETTSPLKSISIADLKINLLVRVLLATESYIDEPTNDNMIRMIETCGQARFAMTEMNG